MTEKVYSLGPELIVLIPHYNNNNGLFQSIISIKESIQLDILIVDDGSSTVPCINKLNEYYTNGKVYLETLEINKGIEYALNYGLKWVIKHHYKFIGRLDCGDICHSDRFKIQLNHLNTNPDIKLLGSQVVFKNTSGDILFYSNLPTTYSKIQRAFYVNCVIIHPSIVFRSEIIKQVGIYPVQYEAAEDYAFFFKIILKYKVENLSQRLLDVVIDDNGISVVKRKQQIRSKIKIIRNNFYWGICPIYGILRNYLLFLIPYSLLLKLKRILKNK